MAAGCRTVVTPKEYKLWLSSNKQILTVETGCPSTRFLLEYHPVEQFKFVENKAPSDEKFSLSIVDSSATSNDNNFKLYAKQYMALDFKLIQGSDTFRCHSAIPDTLLSGKGRYRIELLFDGRIKENEQRIKVLYRNNYFPCASSHLIFDFKKLNLVELPVIYSNPMYSYGKDS